MSIERLSVFGLDHHRSPIALRERLAIAGDDLEGLVASAKQLEGLEGLIVVCTCNRSEFYLAGQGDGLTERVLQLVADQQHVSAAELTQHSYRHHGVDAFRHLFRVVGSLESMVIGEYQIMHQVKQAYEHARLHRSVCGLMNRCFQKALSVGKEVRNETGIGKHKLSVASIAVDLARQIHGRLDKARLLVTGAGEMADLSLQHFIQHGVKRMTIINRNRGRAEDLAKRILKDAGHEVQIRHWSDLADSYKDHDIVLTSTAAPAPVIRYDDIRPSMHRRRNPLMLIDLAVPRDVEPAVADLDDVYVFNIDHLDAVVAKNQQLRHEEIEEVETLLERRLHESVQELDNDLQVLRKQVAGWFEDLVEQEFDRLQKKVQVSDQDQDQLRYGLSRVGAKVQHRLMAWLRNHADDHSATDLVRDLLDLQDRPKE